MGQYHFPVNLDRKEFIDPHKLGTGLKLWEQLANSPGTAGALVILLASASNGSGGGDFRTESEIVGSWRGNRITFVGNYDDESRYLVDGNPISGAEIYGRCSDDTWTDVSLAVAAVIEAELGGKFSGEGWRTFTRNEVEA